MIAGNTARDGFVMKIIAVLTIFFLPGTFMAVSLPLFLRQDFLTKYSADFSDISDV